MAVLARWPNSELLLAAFDQRRLLPPKRSLARFSLSLTLTVSDQTLRHSTSIDVIAFFQSDSHKHKMHSLLLLNRVVLMA